MSYILSKVTAHFESLGTREINVPEWDTVIYAEPVTVAERQRIFAGSKGENDYGVLVKILIEKARDKDGAKIFTLADKATLLQRADSSVVIRVAADIMSGGGAAPSVDDLKNS